MPTIEILTSQGCNKLLVAIVALCILFYARDKQFNVFQITNIYFIYAHSASKQKVDILDCISLLIIYETIYCAFQLNVFTIKQKIKNKMWKKKFFLLYDNMNFYEYKKDQHLYNKSHFLSYIVENLLWKQSLKMTKRPTGRRSFLVLIKQTIILLMNSVLITICLDHTNLPTKYDCLVILFARFWHNISF